MVRKTYEDPVKQKWREAWYQFIKKNKYFLDGNPKTWNIAFFPGEETLELEVYDKLRIPRENLLGLEKNPKVHEKLKKKDLGFRLTDEPVDALDFFKTTNEKFDIVNLDYEGQFNHKVRRTLENIAGRQLLEENSLFGITVYGKREKEDLLNSYKANLILKEIIVSEDKENFLKLEEINQTAFLEERGYLDKSSIKNTAITSIIIDTMVSGLENLIINPIYRNSPDFKLKFKGVKTFFEQRYPKVKDIQINVVQGLNFIFKSFLGEYLNKVGFEIDLSSNITVSTNWYQNKSYLPCEVKRYGYVSRNASLMLNDFFRFSQYREFLKKYKYIADHAFKDLNPLGFFLELLGKESEDYLSACKKYQKKALNILKKDFKFGYSFNKILTCRGLEPRISLGSSAKFPRLIGLEYYKQRYEDAKKGIPIEETYDRLIQNFKVTRTQLPRFEAHYTMETYGPKYIKEEPIKDVEVSENSVVELEDESIADKFQFITNRSWKRLPENRKKRLEYFIQEDLPELNLEKEEVDNFAQELKITKWYEKLNNDEIDDEQFYAFFDDILLESINNKISDNTKLESLLRNITKQGWKNSYPRKIKSLLTYEEYEKNILDGKGEEWISRNYNTKKPNSIRAYKAWFTMRYGKTEKEIGSLGPKIISRLMEGKTKEEVIDEFGLEESNFRGYLAAHKRGAYKNFFKTDIPRTYIDSRGVVHINPKDISEIEKGYE